MKILWLGLSPSTKNSDPTIAFVGTKSNRRLKSWQTVIQTVVQNDNVTVNLSSKVTSNSNDVKSQDMLDAYALIATVKPDAIIGLGNKVSKHLKKLNIEHYHAPHPSFRNRKLNSKRYENSFLFELSQWIETRRNK